MRVTVSGVAPEHGESDVCHIIPRVHASGGG